MAGPSDWDGLQWGNDAAYPFWRRPPRMPPIPRPRIILPLMPETSNHRRILRNRVAKQERASLFGEVGVTGLTVSGGIPQEEFLTQLSPGREVRVYTEMARNDPIIAAVLFAIDKLLRRVPWDVDPGARSSAHLAAAQFLEENRDDMSQTWADFISEVLSLVPFGWSYHEIVWKRRAGRQRTPGESSRFADGKIGIRKLPIRSQDSLRRWDFDDAGGIRAMVQSASLAGFQERFIPINKALLFRTGVYKNNPEGLSALRGAFRPWQFKRRIEEFEAIGIERELNGIPVAKVPPEMLHSGASSGDKALLDGIKKLVRNIKFNNQAGVVFPLAYDEEGRELFKLELLANNGRRAIDTNKVIERLSRHIAMTVLADVILIGHEKVGSMALASSKTTLFATALGAYLDGIEEVLNRHLVPRLFALNGQLLDPLPRFRHGDVETVDPQELAETIAKLSQAGMGLFPSEGGRLERWILEQLNAPLPPEGETEAVPSEEPEPGPVSAGDDDA